MNEPDPPMDGVPIPDETLRELERNAEQGEFVGALGLDWESKNHQRYYAIVESLSTGIRDAIASCDAIPELNDYEELTEVGRGGMGIVYRACHKETKRIDAIKVLRRDRLATLSTADAQTLRDRFYRESQLAAKVAHENIVPVYQVSNGESPPWFSMQYIDGKSLSELTRLTPMNADRTATIIEGVARAVDKLHRHGILHGDIKPQNIMIEDESMRPLITDFGLSEILHQQIDDSSIGGTMAYMAPELLRMARGQIQDDEAPSCITTASDVYSIGATLWSTLVGRSPSVKGNESINNDGDLETQNGDGKSSPELEKTIPAGLRKVCDKCMQIDPVNRYGTAGEVADDLKKWMERPRWHQHFPMLRYLLWAVVSPFLLASGFGIKFLLDSGAGELWVWSLIFLGYVPLFSTFLFSQQKSAHADRARRELWSIWIGHLVGSLACMLSIRMICQADLEQTIRLFYPMWTAISAVVFFAKSGNFWALYRTIGICWAVATLAMGWIPDYSPIIFGCVAAMTGVLVAWGDRSFWDKSWEP